MRKEFKKILSMLLTLTMVVGVLSSVPFTASAAETNSEVAGETYTSGDFEYQLEENYDWENDLSYNVARITEYNGSDADVIIPSEIDGYKVSAIDGLYYYENTDLIKSFTIPQSVGYIKDYIFECYDNLENIFVNDENEDYCDIDGVLFSLQSYETVTPYSLVFYPRAKSDTTYQIPEGVKSVNFAAFYGCSNLVNINVPKSIQSFPVVGWWNEKCWGYTIVENINVSSQNETYSSVDGVLLNKDMTELILYPAGKKQTNYSIPETVLEICEGAFYTANNLESVKIPDSVVTIEEEAFYRAENLSDFNIPDSVNVIGNNAFHYTSWYDNLEDGVIYINKFLYKYKGWMPENTSITIKDGTKSICDYVFSYRSYLINVEFPDSVTYIGEKAFVGCNSLADVKLPENITFLGNNAFSECENLKSINIPEQLTETGWNVFSDCTNLETVYFNAIASRNDEDIYFNFSFEDSVKTVIYGDKVTYISNDFRDNTNLENVVLGSNVKSIGYSAFSGCKGLTSIVIPNSVKEIGESAFCDCTNLANIQIPSDIEKVGADAFSNTEWYNNQPDGLMYIGKVLYDFKGDKTKVTDVEIKEGTTAILDNVFADSSNLKNVTIPDSVTSIGRRAFSNCTSLESITVPENVSSLGWGMFSDCTSLKNAKLPSNAEGSLGDTFNGCENLESVNIPEGITGLWFAFSGCTSLKNVTIPESVTDIFIRSFENCTSLESIVIPKNVSSVAQDAFSGCTSLKSLIVDSDNENYYSVDGALCSKTKGNKLICYAEGKNEENVAISNGVEIIGQASFSNCKSIKSIDLPDTVTEIMYFAFSNCTSLAYVNIPESVKSIGTPYNGLTFYNCKSLKAVTIPSSVEVICSESFGYNYDEEEQKVKPYEDFTIYGKSGSAAETYANENNFTFVDLDNKNYSHADKTSGINVVAKADAELSVTKISDKQSLDDVKLLIESDESILGMYDISLMKDSNKVQHEGMAEVQIPCSDENAKVYRLESDNTLTDMNAVYKDGNLHFYTEHFSKYVVTGESNCVCGDVNGDNEVNAKDRMMLTRYLAKWSGYENIDTTAADVNSDDAVNAKDRMILTRHLAKWQGYETLPLK